TIKFFLSYANPRIEAVFAVKDYFDFITDLGLAFGASFELPMLATLLGAFGILKAEFLVKFRRYAILGIVVAAAVLTPPDVVSQILLSLPMLGLYELSILILKVQGRSRARRERLEAEAETEGDATEA
ncbi:MAG: twin-arginine translocase subunit TatC, partial [Spirochaetaceae bacterium]|nr:twin-arginine translocase subunit TatC [Spirochaetaceae bacterium]